MVKTYFCIDKNVFNKEKYKIDSKSNLGIRNKIYKKKKIKFKNISFKMNYKNNVTLSTKVDKNSIITYSFYYVGLKIILLVKYYPIL